MFHYILQTIAFQLFFLIIYDVFLKKETFFNWNRFYLLITAIISVVLPFIKLESIRTIVPEQFVIRLPEVIIGDLQTTTTNQPTEIASELITNSNFIWSWDYLLYGGMILASLLLIYKIYKITVLIQNNPKRWKDNFIIVSILKSNAAFSFFNYIFLGELIKEDEKEIILKHELVHVSQKHSLDLLLFEILRIAFWFNPLIYMYQNRITTLHEYISDAQAVKQNDKKQYYEKLLAQLFETENISFTNTFFKQSLIKKRILMLGKSRSNRINLLKYALLIPMVFGMMMYTSSYAQEPSSKNSSYEDKVNQNLTDEQLQKKLYDEIMYMEKNGAGFSEIHKIVMPVDSKYISSRTEYYRFMAYADYIFEKGIDRKLKEGSLEAEEIEEVEKMKENRKTYQDYLEWKKTDKAKDTWESGSRDGVLRLVVDDMNNLSEIEKKRKQQKIDLINRGNFFHSLLITDGKNASQTDFDVNDVRDVETIVEVEETEMREGEDVEVPFSVIDEVPTTEDCKSLATNEEKRICFSNYISDFVNQNFNTKLAKKLKLTGKQRISVMFKIGKDGNVNEVFARAPHPGLETEAKRVIRLLPQMIPGKQRGKAVIVPYSLPILFEVNE
ncbi:MAG: M56 family metallopeptidase [Aquaticitalea sp.]